ncbi:hypothetical protein [Pelomicrobium methylotrophicum]|nr:hypothetical protein [Pelomicrobium methylotrophicum]
MDFELLQSGADIGLFAFDKEEQMPVIAEMFVAFEDRDVDG